MEEICFSETSVLTRHGVTSQQTAFFSPICLYGLLRAQLYILAEAHDVTSQQTAFFSPICLYGLLRAQLYLLAEARLLTYMPLRPATGTAVLTCRGTSSHIHASTACYGHSCTYLQRHVFSPIFLYGLLRAQLYSLLFCLLAEAKNELLLTFSVYTNGKKLLNTKSSGDTLQAVHGMRFISICWVVWGHRYTVDAATPSVNLLVYPEVSAKTNIKSGQRKNVQRFSSRSVCHHFACHRHLYV
jgi:hypothetical protein